jgi:hypothetical protein
MMAGALQHALRQGAKAAFIVDEQNRGSPARLTE